MHRILFIGHRESSFCINDERILAKEFEVVPLHIPSVGQKMLLRLPFTIFRALRNCDMVYVWFGSVPAAIAVFMAKLLRKPSLIVAGGYDVANDPDLNYGLLNRRFVRFFPKYAFNNCDKVLAVSDFTKEEALRIIRDGSKVEVVPNGIDTNEFRVTGEGNRSTITTVGNVNHRTWVVKGFNHFMEVVKRSPDRQFVLVGRVEPDVGVEPLDNLRLVGYRTGQDLVNILNDTKHYLQLSYRESFGVAVVEAMACGCIPVVTDQGGLPEVVGEEGTIVEFGSLDQVIESISQDYDPEKGLKARDRVVRLYDKGVREEAVLKAVRKLLSI